MARYTIAEIELPNGDVCTIKDATSTDRTNSLLETLDTFIRTKTLWNDVEDSSSDAILDSNGDPIVGRVMFTEL